MITEAILSFFLNLVIFVLGLIPDNTFSFVLHNDTAASVLGYALYFFPRDLWIFILSDIVFLVGFTTTYVIIEWVYKKIPGVD